MCCFLILPGRFPEGRLCCGKRRKIRMDPASLRLFESTSNRQGLGTRGKFSLSPWEEHVRLERSLSAAAAGGAEGKNFSLGVRSPSGWCREQFDAPSIVLSSYVTRLSRHRGAGTLRGLTMLATAGTVGKWDGSGYGWGVCTVQMQRVHPKSFATHLVLRRGGRTAYLLSAAQGFRRTSSTSELQNVLLAFAVFL